MNNSKGTGGFCGMLAVGVLAIALLFGGFWALLDGANVDYIAPMPTPHAQDSTSDILTMSDGEPIEMSPELAEVAIMDEVTDLARDVSDNQLAQSQSANGAIAGVAVAGYAANTAIVTSFNARDVILAICVVAGLFLFLQIKRSSNEKRQ